MTLVKFTLLFLSCVICTGATTLTYQVAPNENACFYVQVMEVPRRISFYFAVQSGGQFDIDYKVQDPGQKVLMSGSKERQGDYVFAASVAGEYSFCFNNDISTFTHKLVDFDIVLQDDLHSLKAELPEQQSKSHEEKTRQQVLNPMEESIYQIGAALADISRNQNYIKTRESRNFETVQSTEARIFYFAVFESVLVVGMSLMQVFVVRMFFRTTHSKGRI